MANTVRVDQLANVIMQGLTEYADAQSEMVKQSVKDVSKEVKKDMEQPCYSRKLKGDYENDTPRSNGNAY